MLHQKSLNAKISKIDSIRFEPPTLNERGNHRYEYEKLESLF